MSLTNDHSWPRLVILTSTERIERWVEEHITDVQQRQHLDIDMEVKFNDVTPRLYKSLRVLSPYGPGNQKPMFVVRRIPKNRFCI